MNSDDNAEADKRRRAEQAAFIVRRLDENPDDRDAIKDRDAFLARGEAERRTYRNVERAFAGARQGLSQKSRRNYIAVFVFLLASAYFAWEPTRVFLLANHRTHFATENVVLASGDGATLDASSAISDSTDDDVRKVDLLKGAGFFTVNKNGRRFVVLAGEVTVEALGTEFEVSRLSDSVVVSVREGLVEVSRSGNAWRLHPGERVKLSFEGTRAFQVASSSVAGWRERQLLMDGMTLGEVASIVGRRLPGKVIVLGNELRSIELAGGLDLTKPLSALQTIAAASEASVYQITPYLTIVRAN